MSSLTCGELRCTPVFKLNFCRRGLKQTSSNIFKATMFYRGKLSLILFFFYCENVIQFSIHANADWQEDATSAFARVGPVEPVVLLDLRLKEKHGCDHSLSAAVQRSGDDVMKCTAPQLTLRCHSGFLQVV